MHDPFAVTLVKEGVTVGPIPCAISSVCYLNLGKGGSLCCKVTGTRQYSQDLPQGGLEIPCQLIFCGDTGVIIKVQKLLEEFSLLACSVCLL
jgi:hypothetical protein